MITTRALVRAALLLLAVIALLWTATAQDSTLVRRPRAQSSPQRVITWVPFNGTRCFIALVPIDTSNIDHMPIVGRRSEWPDQWLERNIPIYPDSLLRRLPRKEGPLK